MWIIRSLPLSISQIIGARVVAAQVVNTIGCLLGLVPIAYFFGWGVLEVVFGTVFGILLASVVAFLLALLDLSRPMLDWVNPVKAVKSNLNAIIGTFGSLALGFLLGLLFFFNRQTGTLWLIPLELGFVTALFAGLARLLVTRVAPRLWTKI